MARRRLPRSREDVDSTRMSLGDHLNELRTCIVRSLSAIVIACLICIWPAKYLLGFLARPAFVIMRAYNQHDSFLATSPVEVFLIYAKVVVITGLVISGPYVLRQLWVFIAAGLYPGERRAALRYFPHSVVLFLIGTLFMFYIVLPVSLNFLIGFSNWLDPPEVTANWFERGAIVSADQPTSTQPNGESYLRTVGIRALTEDPRQPEGGDAWINTHDRRLKIQTDYGVYSVPMMLNQTTRMVSVHLKISDYLSFLLALLIVFGIAFQTPLVVLFLARSGIAPVEVMRKRRKIVIFIIVVVAGMVAPADLMSHILLATPMILLFELGLLMAARTPRRADAGSSGTKA